MPKVTEEDILNPRGYSLWIAGPDKSGKSRLALGFPDVFMIKFNPSGDDLLLEPENAALIPNLKWRVEMNELPLDKMFAFSEEPGETGIYPAIALAKQQAKTGEIKTFLLDDITYLVRLKWSQILLAEGIDPLKKEEVKSRKDWDAMKCYDALGAYLDNLMLRNIMPLVSPPHNLNLLVTSHTQRESDNTIKGTGDNTGSRKRLVNLDSDLAPDIVGSFRQRIGGLMGATIYLEHIAGTKEIEEKGEKKVIEEVKYFAYCKMTRSATLDTLVRAGNRYGLPAKLNLTGASLYKTLLKKRDETRARLTEIQQQQTSQPKSEMKTDAAATAPVSKSKG